jgi:hypothetical protein
MRDIDETWLDAVKAETRRQHGNDFDMYTAIVRACCERYPNDPDAPNWRALLRAREEWRRQNVN